MPKTALSEPPKKERDVEQSALLLVCIDECIEKGFNRTEIINHAARELGKRWAGVTVKEIENHIRALHRNNYDDDFPENRNQKFMYRKGSRCLAERYLDDTEGLVEAFQALKKRRQRQTTLTTVSTNLICESTGPSKSSPCPAESSRHQIMEPEDLRLLDRSTSGNSSPDQEQQISTELSGNELFHTETYNTDHASFEQSETFHSLDGNTPSQSLREMSSSPPAERLTNSQINEVQTLNQGYLVDELRLEIDQLKRERDSLFNKLDAERMAHSNSRSWWKSALKDREDADIRDLYLRTKEALSREVHRSADSIKLDRFVTNKAYGWLHPEKKEITASFVSVFQDLRLTDLWREAVSESTQTSFVILNARAKQVLERRSLYRLGTACSLGLPAELIVRAIINSCLQEEVFEAGWPNLGQGQAELLQYYQQIIAAGTGEVYSSES